MILVHSEPGHIFCSICSRQFASSEQLAEHRSNCIVRKRERERDRKQAKFGRFESEICKTRAFKTNKYLQEHIRKQHIPNYKKFKCETCGSKFVRESSLKSHTCWQKQDTKSEIVNCEWCWKSLSIKSLQMHKLLVHSESATVCKQCCKQFSNFQELNEHRAECLKKKQMRKKAVACFECDICNAKITRKELLLKHMHDKHHPSGKRLKWGECCEVISKMTLLRDHNYQPQLKKGH